LKTLSRARAQVPLKAIFPLNIGGRNVQIPIGAKPAGYPGVLTFAKNREIFFATKFSPFLGTLGAKRPEKNFRAPGGKIENPDFGALF